METHLLQILDQQPSPDQVGLAVETLRRGQVVALPTETVYGLAGVATDLGAVAEIFAAKERPTFDPLIVHIPNRDWAWIERLTDGLTKPQREIVEYLREEFWPGPLTLLLPKNQEVVPDLVTAGSPWVALRSPAHPVFRAVLEELNQPLAAPSANRFGRISPTTAQHVMTELGGRIPLVIDGGNCAFGLESTILKIDEKGEGTILRPGPIPEENLRALMKIHDSPAVPARAGDIEAPGTLESHYAPRTPLRLIAGSEDLPNAGRDRIGYLGWGEESRETYQDLGALRMLCKKNGDWSTAAQNLFRMMRELDEANLEVIYARQLPEEGLARAIMDRLRRASAKRPD